MELGGGPPYSLARVLGETASLAAGGPARGAGAVVVAVLFLAGVVVGLRTWRRAPLGWLCGIIMGLPLLQVLVAPPPFLFPRYFLVPVLLGQLCLSVALAAWYRRGRWGRWGYAAAVACLLIGQTWHTVRLVQIGRGPVRAALAFMASRSPSDPIVISSDHNFGIGKLVAFYRTAVQPPRTFVYVGGQSWPVAGPDWLVRHGEATHLPGWKRVEQIDGHTFRLERVFSCAPYSGWYWACYRRQQIEP
ncbi:MAG: hypothetical protein AB7F89_22485 [Pirellulaceae bacterium]